MLAAGEQTSEFQFSDMQSENHSTLISTFHMSFVYIYRLDVINHWVWEFEALVCALKFLEYCWALES